MQQRLDLDNLEPIRLPFTYDGKSYALHEATAGDVLAWRSFQRAGGTQETEPERDKRLLESGPYLVSLCLHEGGAPVSLEQVSALPHTLVERLVTRTLEISGLLAKRDQATLEKEFADLVRELAELSDNASEKGQWRDWIVGEVDRIVHKASCNGTAETPEKNAPSAMPVASA